MKGSEEIDWAKNKLAKRFRGRYVPLASHRVGSFVIDKLYRGCKIKTKASIVEELLQGERILSGTKAGRELFKLCNAERFKRDRKEWMATFGNYLFFHFIIIFYTTLSNLY